METLVPPMILFHFNYNQTETWQIPKTPRGLTPQSSNQRFFAVYALEVGNKAKRLISRSQTKTTKSNQWNTLF